MKIKNITQVSFLALMLGMTGSLSSLSLAQAVEEAVKPKPTVTAEKSDNSVIKSEAKEPASASGYRPIALGKTVEEAEKPKPTVKAEEPVIRAHE